MQNRELRDYEQIDCSSLLGQKDGEEVFIKIATLAGGGNPNFCVKFSDIKRHPYMQCIGGELFLLSFPRDCSKVLTPSEFLNRDLSKKRIYLISKSSTCKVSASTYSDRFAAKLETDNAMQMKRVSFIKYVIYKLFKGY